MVVALTNLESERKINRCVFDGNFKQKCEGEIGSDHLYEKRGKHFIEQFMDILILYLDGNSEENKTELHVMNSDQAGS